MSKTASSIIAGLLTVLLQPCHAVAQGDELLERLRNWAKGAEQQYSNVEVCSKWISYRGADQVVQITQHDCTTAGRYSVIRLTHEFPRHGDTQLRTYITGDNTRYRFDLTVKDVGYVLTKVHAPPYDQYKTWQCAFAVPGTPDTFHGLLACADTRVADPVAVDWHGRPHTEWVLDTTTGNWQTTARSPARIGLLVRNDRPGVVCGVRQYHPEEPTHWLHEWRVEYTPGGEPWPTPRAIEEWVAERVGSWKDTTKPVQTRRSSRYEFSHWRSLPPGPPGVAFTLSGYDLPEPTELAPWDMPEGVPTGASSSTQPSPSVEPARPPQVQQTTDTWAWPAIGLLMILAGAAYVRRRRQDDGPTMVRVRDGKPS